MDLMISVDDSTPDNRWWKELFCLYARSGEYFEIHCWSDEAAELELAKRYGSTACYSMPDIKIVHGIMTDELIRFFLQEEKPADCRCYNKMVPFFTVRIGRTYSSEKYGTEILVTSKGSSEEESIGKIISNIADHAKLFRSES